MAAERDTPPDPPPPSDIAREVSRVAAENAHLLARLVEGEQRFRAISRGVLKVQEAERGRISRELHDGVGQSLTALRIQLELLEHDLSPGPLRARVSDLRGLAEQSLQDVRQMSHLLRPQMLDELGLMPTLRWLARTFGQRTGLAVELSAEGIGDRLDPELDSLVFRVVQEALTNVAKHARVPSVRVRLAVRGNRLHLSVQDDGQGFEPDSESPAEGFGLRGMRDRVQLFGGRFTLRSRPGQGTTLEAEVPLGRPEAGP